MARSDLDGYEGQAADEKKGRALRRGEFRSKARLYDKGYQGDAVFYPTGQPPLMGSPDAIDKNRFSPNVIKSRRP